MTTDPIAPVVEELLRNASGEEIRSHTRLLSVEVCPPILKSIPNGIGIWRALIERCANLQTIEPIVLVSNFDDGVGKKRIRFDIKMGGAIKSFESICEKLKDVLTKRTIPKHFRRTDILFLAADPSGRHCIKALYAKDCLVTELTETYLELEGTFISGPWAKLLGQSILDDYLRAENDTQQS